jgi:hypothetical protein
VVWHQNNKQRFLLCDDIQQVKPQKFHMYNRSVIGEASGLFYIIFKFAASFCMSKWACKNKLTAQRGHIAE